LHPWLAGCSILGVYQKCFDDADDDGGDDVCNGGAFVKVYPMAVVGTAARGVIIYQLDNQPQEFKRMESPLKYQVTAVIWTIFFAPDANISTVYMLDH